MVFVHPFICDWIFTFSFLRTIGDFTLIHTEAAFGFLEKDAWEKFHKNTGNFGMTYILGIAMAGVGLSTNFKTLKGIG